MSVGKEDGVAGTNAPAGQEAGWVTELSTLLWHIGIFVIVNGFLWLQDALVSDGIQYAYWATIPWTMGLLLHISAYFYGRREIGERVSSQQARPERELEHH